MKNRKISIQSVMAALLGVFLMAVGLAMNNYAMLGNDPVGIVYDGIRSAANLTAEQLGMASNFVNVALVVLLLFIGRHYMSIGTVIYFIPYGTFVSAGNAICQQFLHPEGIVGRIALSILGCLLLYLGIAIYIVVDIGTDPFTGLVLVIRDWCRKEYRVVKICYDVTLIIIGTLLGGKLGAVTVVTAFLGGPVIQMYIDLLNKYVVGRRRKDEKI